MKPHSKGEKHIELTKSCILFSSHQRKKGTTSTRRNIEKFENLNSKKLCFYPNYKISQRGILIKNPKPKTCQCDNLIHKRIFSALKEEKIRESLEIAKNSIFQIVILILNNVDFEFRCKFATGFYIEGSFKTMIMTVFHIFDDYSREYEEIYILQNPTNNDISKIFGEDLNEKRKAIKNIGNFLTLIKELKYKYNLTELYINYQSLLKRKVWVKSNYNHTGKTLDPIFRLQPMPTLDAVVLDSTENILKKGIEISTSKLKPGEIIFHIGYNTVAGDITNKNDEYKCIEIQNPVKISDILHPDKSLSVGNILSSNDGIIDFESTATEGSSGSPLLNSNGEVIGILMGNFNDNESIGECKEKRDIFSFDLLNRKERKSNFFCLKNTNLATNINHPGIYKMLNGKTLPDSDWKIINKKK